MPLLSPAGKYKVRQTRLSLSSWECGVGGKCELAELQKHETVGACVERKNLILRKSKPGFWLLKLESFHRGVFNSFLKAESQVWQSTQYGMKHFVGIRLQGPCALEIMSFSKSRGNVKE